MKSHLCLVHSVCLVALLFAPLACSDPSPNSNNGVKTDAGSLSFDAAAEGAETDTTPDGMHMDITIAGALVSGIVRGSTFTLDAVLPTRFRTTLNAYAVQRGPMGLATEADVLDSCKKALGPLDVASPPSFALRDVLVNPLSRDVILRALRETAEGRNVITVGNPLVLESVTFSDATLQGGLPNGIVGKSTLGISDFPRGNYDWKLLCDGIAGASVVVTSEIKSTVEGASYRGTVEFGPIGIVP
jgi:hypothetical protein